MFDKLRKKMKKPKYEDGGVAKDKEKYGSFEEIDYAKDMEEKKSEAAKGKLGAFVSGLTKNENMHDTVDKKRKEDERRGFFKKR